MKIVVGLGNPGEKYTKTRHNIGFWVVEELAGELDCPKFGFEPKLKSEIIGCKAKNASGQIDPVLLVKPQTYMNSSGEAVGLVLNYYKDRVTLEDLWVVHDDVDLDLGRIKIQRGGGTAGHHGLESIVKAVGGGFVRFRFGIGRPKRGVYNVEDFVLGSFSPDEKGVAQEGVKTVVEALKCGMEKGLEEAMGKFN